MSEDPSRTRESYDEIAATYTESIFTELAGKPLDRHLLNRFAEDVRGHGLVADLGCGPGHVARYLHEHGVRMLGIDLSPRMIDGARKLSPEIEFRVGDMLALELADGALAGIVAFYSLIHIGEGEMGRTLRELRRVLAPGGSWIASSGSRTRRSSIPAAAAISSPAHPRISSTRPETKSTANTTRRKRARSSRLKSNMPAASPATAGTA